MPRCRFLRYLFLFQLLLLLPTNSISLFGFRNKPEVTKPKPNTELVVNVAGKVLLIHEGWNPIWSFSSGSPICSSYQDPHHAIGDANDDDDDDDDDGHDRWEAVGLATLDFLKKTPFVTDDDSVVAVTKTTSAYLVDAISGRLVHASSGDDDDNNMEEKAKNSVELLPLVITRTDTKLERFVDKTTRKVAWNMTVSHFRADLLCDPVGGNELGPEILTGIYFPLQCGSGIDVRVFTKPEPIVSLPLLRYR